MGFLKRKWPAFLITFLILDLVAWCVYMLWTSPNPIRLDLCGVILAIPLLVMFLFGVVWLIYLTWRDEHWR